MFNYLYIKHIGKNKSSKIKVSATVLLFIILYYIMNLNKTKVVIIDLLNLTIFKITVLFQFDVAKLLKLKEIKNNINYIDI